MTKRDGTRKKPGQEPDSLWTLELTLNGKKIRRRVSPTRTLLDFLRIDMELTGTKGACLEGECGSCYVLVDGKPMNSCLMLAPQAQNRDVVTIEGISTDGRLSALQQAFIDQGAVQCGYCTPGLIIAAKALFDRSPRPTREQLLSAIEGNLCRCTGYSKILLALHSAADALGMK
jgi:aerobic-type carbon monoxide dehydrogenase small subunit (CoxS/CutS family)